MYVYHARRQTTYILQFGHNLFKPWVSASPIFIVRFDTIIRFLISGPSVEGSMPHLTTSLGGGWGCAVVGDGGGVGWGGVWGGVGGGGVGGVGGCGGGGGGAGGVRRGWGGGGGGGEAGGGGGGYGGPLVLVPYDQQGHNVVAKLLILSSPLVHFGIHIMRPLKNLKPHMTFIFIRSADFLW